VQTRGEAVRKGVKKAGTKSSTSRVRAGDIEKANARFDRLLEAMAKAPPLPRKRKRIRTRDAPDEKFDD
jgi:hypothetical protein